MTVVHCQRPKTCVIDLSIEIEMHFNDQVDC